jgi:symplekin
LNDQTTGAIDDEEDYEPDFEPEDAEQVINRLDSAPPENLPAKPVPDGPIAPYKLPEAPPLTEQEIQRYGDETIRRSFGMLSSLEETKAKGAKGGFNRLAASKFDRDAWVTIISRLATRASSGLEDPDDGIKSEYNSLAKKGSFTLSDTIRDGLYKYIMYDWKRRLDLAISWLNEEWYNDRVQAEVASKGVNGNGVTGSEPKGHYRKCALRLLDGIITYIEGTDKILVRFMSEIPEVDREILQRMKRMAEDPERIELSIMVLQYLYMFRPPVREICVDVLEDMWRTSKCFLILAEDRY